MVKVVKGLGLVSLLIVLFCDVSASIAGLVPWSDWYQLDDEALNGVYFSWKCDSGTCQWRWDNRYTTEVTIRYQIRYTLANSRGVKKEGRVALAPGENSLPDFSLEAASLEGINVAVIEPKFTGESPPPPPSSTADVDADNRRLSEEKRRQNREQEQLQTARLEQQKSQYEAQKRQEEEARREEKRQQREWDRQQKEWKEQQQRDKVAADESFNRALQEGARSFNESVNRGLQVYGNAVQQGIETDRYIREKKEREAREAREAQERANREQRDAERQREAHERERREQERRDREEQQRIERERQERERQRVAQLEEQQAEQKKKQEEETCHSMTSYVSAEIKHLNEPDNCPGEVVGWLTNNSSVAVTCGYVFIKGNVYHWGEEASITLQPGERSGSGSKGFWSCDRDNYKFACVRADDSDKCKTNVVRRTVGR